MSTLNHKEHVVITYAPTRKSAWMETRPATATSLKGGISRLVTCHIVKIDLRENREDHAGLGFFLLFTFFTFNLIILD